MPLPTARHTLPNVDSTGGQRPGIDPRTHAQVDCLLWGGEFGNGKACIQFVRNVRCQNIRDVSEVVAAPTCTRKTHGHRLGQRPVPPCQVTRTAAAQTSQSADAPVPAAIQSAVGANRTSLETHPTLGYPQPVLRDAWRGTRSRAAMLRSVAKTEPRSEEVMRHYLRRYV